MSRALRDPDGQQVYINQELHEFAAVRRAEDLLEYVKRRCEPVRRLYLFIDSELLLLTYYGICDKWVYKFLIEAQNGSIK